MDVFENNGYVAVKRTREDIVRTPISLLGSTLRRLNEGRKYHSGRISVGVANALAGYRSSSGDTTDSPSPIEMVPRITDGNMYRMSLGQAGSPYELWPTPEESLDTRIRFLREAGELITA